MSGWKNPKISHGKLNITLAAGIYNYPALPSSSRGYRITI